MSEKDQKTDNPKSSLATSKASCIINLKLDQSLYASNSSRIPNYLTTDSGIHHPDEDRVFTTDELKRLMGLPDDFRLTGTFNQKAERCGRMVTPHLYKHLSRSIYEKVILPSR